MILSNFISRQTDGERRRQYEETPRPEQRFEGRAEAMNFTVVSRGGWPAEILIAELELTGAAYVLLIAHLCLTSNSIRHR